VSGDQNPNDSRPSLTHLSQQRNTTLAGHALVGDDDGDGSGFLLEQRHRLSDAGRRQNAEVLFQPSAEILQRLLLVVDVEDAILAGIWLCCAHAALRTGRRLGRSKRTSVHSPVFFLMIPPPP